MSDPVFFRYVIHVAHDYGFSAPTLKTAKASQMQIATVAFVLYWCSWDEVVACKQITEQHT